MEKSAVSRNDEWIVDGDFYLIKTISRYPILWDRKHFDSDQRNEVWLKLSKKLNIKLEWMKKRWSYLREQYVRHLKQMNNSEESDNSSKRNYKYFNEMSFLADHIQIRGNYQHVISHMAYKPDSNNDDSDTTRIESNNQIEVDDNVNVMENENVDFVITENEIEAYNDDDEDDDENLFVELSDEENYVKVQLPTEESLLQNYSKVVIQTHMSQNDNKNTSSDTKPVAVMFGDVNTLESTTAEQHLTTNIAAAENENYQIITKPVNDARCEDVIFGELVTSMLKKMDSPNRKRAKKEILNILLS